MPPVETHQPAPRELTGQPPAKAEWVSPALVRLRAGDAELGANPIVPEGIGFGS